jgi:hypothetical protein
MGMGPKQRSPPSPCPKNVKEKGVLMIEFNSGFLLQHHGVLHMITNSQSLFHRDKLILEGTVFD